MSPDSYTEVTTKGLGSRLGASIKGVLVGVVMVTAAFPVLFWNEGRAVQTAKSLAEGRGAVVEGTWAPEGYFKAMLIMAKHSEEYQAPHDEKRQEYEDLVRNLRGAWLGEENQLSRAVLATHVRPR